jgi:hypothetical protein
VASPLTGSFSQKPEAVDPIRIRMAANKDRKDRKDRTSGQREAVRAEARTSDQNPAAAVRAIDLVFPWESLGSPT